MYYIAQRIGTPLISSTKAEGGAFLVFTILLFANMNLKTSRALPSGSVNKPESGCDAFIYRSAPSQNWTSLVSMSVVFSYHLQKGVTENCDFEKQPPKNI